MTTKIIPFPTSRQKPAAKRQATSSDFEDRLRKSLKRMAEQKKKLEGKIPTNIWETPFFSWPEYME